MTWTNGCMLQFTISGVVHVTTLWQGERGQLTSASRMAGTLHALWRTQRQLLINESPKLSAVQIGISL